MSARLTAVVANVSSQACKGVCEFLKEYGYEIKGVTDSGLEAMQLIKQFTPDVVLTDICFEDADASEILQLLKNQEYSNAVAVITTSLGGGTVIERVLTTGADMFMLVPFDKRYADKKIREIHSRRALQNGRSKTTQVDIRDEFDVLNYISNLMHDVGVPASIRGYDYIRESIVMALEDRNILKAITKQLYPQVAKNNSTTASRVERAIRHAVEVAWGRGDVDVLNGIFGYTVKSTKGKPTNGEFISMLAERVKLDLKIS